MPFASNKSPEQLEAEKKAKKKTMVLKAVVYLQRVSKMRNNDPVIKNHLVNDVIPDLQALAEELGK